ncbi:MAG: DUF3800 domain-containing protein [Thermodesulfobacteriota bacterium]|nr:DUF3800 domain-containing protein [Thermodesulfobacteriota bacterium]
MKIDVYCDEAYPDLFSSKKSSAKYLMIGAIWLNRENRSRFKADIQALRNQYRIGGEFKWNKVSRSKIIFYKALLSWFHEQGNELRFRCVAVDKNEVDLIKFHSNDQELGFYKFYYQMLHHWIHSFNEYQIFCDFKRNRRSDRLHTLKRCLVNANISASIVTVQSSRSEKSVLMQCADVLVGMASARMNDCLTAGGAKLKLVEHYENLYGRRILPTPLSEKKFNLFKINLAGGW